MIRGLRREGKSSGCCFIQLIFDHGNDLRTFVRGQVSIEVHDDPAKVRLDVRRPGTLRGPGSELGLHFGNVDVISVILVGNSAVDSTDST